MTTSYDEMEEQIVSAWNDEVHKQIEEEEQHKKIINAAKTMADRHGFRVEGEGYDWLVISNRYDDKALIKVSWEFTDSHSFQRWIDNDKKLSESMPGEPVRVSSAIERFFSIPADELLDNLPDSYTGFVNLLIGQHNQAMIRACWGQWGMYAND
jgi:hypothetical protein